MQALTADYRRNLLKLQMFNYSCSFTTPTKWNTAAIKILLLFEAGLLISFWGCGKLRHEIQRKWKLNMEAFTAEYGKSFWPHLLAFRSCIPGELRGGPTTWRNLVYLWSTDLWHHIRLQSCCSVFERGTKIEAAKAKLLSDARLQTAKDSPWHSSKPCSWVDVSATLRGVIQPSSGEPFLTVAISVFPILFRSGNYILIDEFSKSEAATAAKR